MQEQWKPIQGYEGIYEVSNLGRVRSKERIVCNGNHKKYVVKGRILKPFKSPVHKEDYYYKVSLCNGKNKKKYLIHRLVAHAFVDNPYNFPCVNHIDGNKLNNRFDNLEWCTFSLNNHHAYDNGLRTPYQKKIDYQEATEMLNDGKTKEEVARFYGVTIDAVYKALQRKKIGDSFICPEGLVKMA